MVIVTILVISLSATMMAETAPLSSEKTNFMSAQTAVVGVCLKTVIVTTPAIILTAAMMMEIALPVLTRISRPRAAARLA
jgi:hypothetical protein